MSEENVAKILEIRNECACLQARQYAQTLTKEYDRILAPSALKLTQFSTIAALLAGPLSITKLAEALELDRTTISRNLTPLERKAFIKIDGSEDARERLVALTPLGRQATSTAYKLWQQAQAIYAVPQIV
jgi:DNA-binding MarR family transcriptional regulator